MRNLKIAQIHTLLVVAQALAATKSNAIAGDALATRLKVDEKEANKRLRQLETAGAVTIGGSQVVRTQKDGKSTRMIEFIRYSAELTDEGKAAARDYLELIENYGGSVDTGDVLAAPAAPEGESNEA